MLSSCSDDMLAVARGEVSGGFGGDDAVVGGSRWAGSHLQTHKTQRLCRGKIDPDVVTALLKWLCKDANQR